ncbi:MAG: V-type ATP synthase subunit E [Clostridia bacterium]|nr:V-type ATP synthase subunit E [Clostridia bacterium]
MSQLEDKKLEKFTSAVLKDAQDQRDTMLSEIDEYRKAQMEEAEEAILNETYVMIQNEITAVKNAQSRKVSLAELDCRRSLLLLREKITGEVFDEAAQRILAFTATPEYVDFVCGLLKQGAGDMPDGETVIFVKKDDLKNAGPFLAAYGKPAVCEADAGITLGGAVIFNREKGVVINQTLDVRLSNQKDWFAASSGLAIG